MTLRSGLPEVVEFSASGGGVALRPVTPAVMAEQPLDDNVVSSHGYTTMHAAELIRLASRPDSKQRSIDRVADPPREVKELLRAINETRDFWKALRSSKLTTSRLLLLERLRCQISGDQDVVQIFKKQKILLSPRLFGRRDFGTG